MEIPAEELLQLYDLSSLQQMARAQGVKARGGGKKAFAPALARELYSATRIKRALADLSKAERTLLDRVILAGGDVQTTLVRNQLEGDGITDKPVRDTRFGFSHYNQERGTYSSRNSRKFEDLVARLGGLGLLFTLDPKHSTGYIVSITQPGNRLVIPDGILEHLPSVTFETETVPEPGSVQPGDATPLLRDLYLLFSLADREKIALTNRGLIMKRSLTKIGQVLDREKEVAAVKTEDQVYGFSLLRGLAEALGLLASSVGELLLDPRGEQFLGLPSTERRQRLFDAYRTTARWSELHRIPDLTVRGKGLTIYSAPQNVPPARQRVLAELAELPSGEWIAVEHLISRLRTRAYEFLFSRTPSPDSYYGVNYRYYGYGHFNPYHHSINGLGVTLDIESERDGWDVAEAGFIRVVVTEALHALGVVDLGGDGDATTAFRITDDGASLLRGEPLAGEEIAAQVIVQPNFQVFAFLPTGEDILFTLDRIADRVRTGQAMEYELTQASIYRAQQAGLDTAAVIEFLERVSTHELPQNVRRTIEEWGSQHERITLRRRAALLQTTDEAALDALYADERLAPLLGRRLSATVALAPTDRLGAVDRHLIESGQLAALSEGPGFQPGPQLDLRSDGAVAFRQQTPSIYALHDLRSFVDAVEGSLRLTPESLRRGARTGLDADDIIAILERLSGGALPDAPAALVRRWAKDWGSGAIYDATILQLDQPQQLTDLLADPEVRPHLQPVPGAPTIAIVPPKSRKRVRTLLEARGMTLGEGHRDA
jgi:hypothetical protein